MSSSFGLIHQCHFYLSLFTIKEFIFILFLFGILYLLGRIYSKIITFISLILICISIVYLFSLEFFEFYSRVYLNNRLYSRSLVIFYLKNLIIYYFLLVFPYFLLLIIDILYWWFLFLFLVTRNLVKCLRASYLFKWRLDRLI